MLIESAEVRCFRTIEHVRVPFMAGLNIVHGENDAGKSTLMEAIHTCLTVPHRSSGKVLDRMRSRLGGVPEVAVTFRRDGKTYDVRKTYGKGASASLLVRDGGRTTPYKSDEAESELRRVLGIESTSARTSDLGILPLLWVRQGDSGTLPDLQQGGAAVQLGQRLRAISGEVIGGTSGEKLYSRITQVHGETYTSLDRPAANGPLAPARAAHEQAQAAVNVLEERKRAHEQAAEQFDREQEKLRSVEAALPDLTKTADAAERELAATKALVADRRTLVSELERAKMSVTHAAEHVLSRGSAADRMNAAQDELRTSIESRATAEAQWKAASAALGPVEHEFAQAEEAVTGCANAAVSAQTAVRAIFSRREFDAVAVRLDKARACNAELLETTHALALEPIDEERLRRIEAQHQAVEVADARLGASATEMELHAVRPVAASIDGEDLPVVPGEPLVRTVVAEAVLRIDDLVQVKIRPGGEDLAARRQAMTHARAQLHKALSSVGALDLATVRARAASRKETVHKKKLAEEMLAAHAPAGLEALVAELAELQVSLAAAPLELTKGLDLPGAQETERIAVATLETARLRVERARDALQTARTHHERARSLLESSIDAVTRATQQLERAKAELAASIAARGDDDALSAKHAQAVQVLNEAQVRLGALDAQLSPTAESEAASKLDRARRALQTAQREREVHSGESVRLAERLQAQDLIGLDDRIAAARARLDATATDLRRQSERGEALKLLLRIVTEERSSAHRRLEAPLRRALEEMLGVLSPGSRIELGEGYAVKALERVADGRHDFDDLGFGSREQLAILVRLAAARVLQNGEPLCVMLDDAIVFSSEARFARVKPMLIEAARHLQIIVLTCHWDRYRDLGAENVIDLEQARAAEQTSTAENRGTSRARLQGPSAASAA